MRRNLKSFFLVTLVISIYLIVSFAGAVEPFGASVTPGASQRAPQDSPQGVAAYAGNITEVNVFGYSITQSWQGYFGNVTGVIQLANSDDEVMYNWSLASPSGEIFASTNGSTSISWPNVQCFNFTAVGNYSSESGTGGTTSLYGTNLTTLETMYNISGEDVDGVNETFTLIGAGTHDMFFVNNLQFSEGECRNTRVYDSSGQGVNNNFEEVLMYEPVSTSIIFASILDNNLAGFDADAHDFEMLVLENGHGSDTAPTTYYFYVELE